MIKDYIILERDTSHHLATAVREMLSEGYTPHGSIFAQSVSATGDVTYLQAMIKSDDKPLLPTVEWSDPDQIDKVRTALKNFFDSVKK